MTLDDVCKQVLELDEKATKGPWESSKLSGEITFMNWNGIKRIGEVDINSDGPSIANYRISAPLLAKACLRMKEALENWQKIDYPGWAQDILADVEEIFKGK